MLKIVDFLKVYQFDNKIRLGEKSDGGYVIGDISGNYDCYISAGVSTEESFSRDFIQKYNMTSQNSFAFDGTIDKYPYDYTKDIKFYKYNIGCYNNNKYTNLHGLIKHFNNIFLKMDIEGGEYPWLLSLSQEQLSKFKQITMEFHGINDDSWGSIYAKKLRCFINLTHTHYLVHIHGNNYSGCQNGIPDVVELTYINKNYFDKEPELNITILPIIDLDFPNRGDIQDYSLSFEPFLKTKKDHMELIFTNLYENKLWGDNNNSEYKGSSGTGSEVNYNIDTYVPFLQKFIFNNNIKSIVDLGCGDFRCGRLLYDDLDILYTGYDTYEKVIEYNSKQNELQKYSFIHLDFLNNKESIVNGDICILKDVIQHWSLNNIYTFLDYLVENKIFKYILICNCSNQTANNTDIQNGEFRPLSCHYFPLKKYNPTKLYNYYSKEVSVIQIQS